MWCLVVYRCVVVVVVIVVTTKSVCWSMRMAN